MRAMISGLFAAATLTATIAACGPGFDEFTGGDGSRGEAREVAVDATLDDRLSADDGDHTDWKTFSLDSGGTFSAKVWWDTPDVTASITLRDELGQQLARVAHTKGARIDVLGPVKVKEGNYFLELTATSGSSVYTYELSLGAGASDLVPDI